jgi:hypothetical protein
VFRDGLDVPDLNPVLVTVWSVFIAVGLALIVLGLYLRRRDDERRGVPANAVVWLGILLLVGGGVALRQELSS